LKLLTGRVDVKTDVLWQGKVHVSATAAKTNGIPSDVANQLDSGGSMLQREVDLCDAHGLPLCYATSWWNLENADKVILDDGAANSFGALERPVWLKLAENKTELFREVRRVYRGTSDPLASAWGLPNSTTFWARHYIFWCARKPLCVIHEVMSPRLELHLGPSDPARKRLENGSRSFPSDDLWL
jgi:chorismate lyase